METETYLNARGINHKFSLETTNIEAFESARNALESKTSELARLNFTNPILIATGIPLSLSGCGLVISSPFSKSSEALLGGLGLVSIGYHLLRSYETGVKRAVLVSKQIEVIKNFLGER